MDSLIVNLFAGPGAGKSTMRAGVFSDLKMILQYTDTVVEEVTEYAKDLTWEERHATLGFQPYVLAKQWRNIERVYGKAHVIVVDSPLLLSAVYADEGHLRGDVAYSVKRMALAAFTSYSNLNFFVERVKPYSPVGRSQSEEGARDLDTKIRTMLTNYGVDFQVVPGDWDGRNQVVSAVLRAVDSL